jgi:hypothetical protein
LALFLYACQTTKTNRINEFRALVSAGFCSFGTEFVHNGLMSVDVAALISSLHFWENIEYVSCVVGVACETIAGIKSLIKSESHRVIIERIFAVVLCIGILRELAGLVKASRLPGEIIDGVNQKASAADAQAAEAR